MTMGDPSDRPTIPIQKGADRAAIGALLAVVASAAQERGLSLSPAGLKRSLREAVARDPIDALAVTVLGGAYFFYLAEKGHNEKVKTYWDALVFVSTSLSVGYADIFARTPSGQAIATALNTFGPAISGAALEAPATPEVAPKLELSDEALAVQRAILDKLDAILVELRGKNEPEASPERT
jgi:voltage-gated potassium channel